MGILPLNHGLEARATFILIGALRKERLWRGAPELGVFARGLRRPWTGALVSTLFTDWIYDFLKPHAAALKAAHPAMLKAIAANTKKNDRVDAEKKSRTCCVAICCRSVT